MTTSASLKTHLVSSLDVEHIPPERFKPISEAALSIKQKAITISQHVYQLFTQFHSSFFDLFLLQALLEKLKACSIKDLTLAVTPYLLAALIECLSSHVFLKHTRLEAAESMLCLIFIGYLMSYKITQRPPSEQSMWKTCEIALCLFSLVNLHRNSYRLGSHLSRMFLINLKNENYISDETFTGTQTLSGITSSMAILPKLVLSLESRIQKYKEGYERKKGLFTQVSKTAKLQGGKLKELNCALQLYSHFTAQLHDKARLFQYFIVSLNVLKDVIVEDHSSDSLSPKKGVSKTLNKTRNLWLLAVDSFIKARADVSQKLKQICFDTQMNLETFDVIRGPLVLSKVSRFQLEVGDLVPLSQALHSSLDEATGISRQKVKLCGYLTQLGEEKTKAVAISLVELNGENQPLILSPARKAKLKSECQEIDLFHVPHVAGLLNGTEFLSFDNENASASCDDLYIQIAKGTELGHPKIQKVPLILQDTKALKDRLITESLLASFVLSAPLIDYKRDKSWLYYSTQAVDKFTQVFSELQQIIPLVSEIAEEMITSTLLKQLNTGLKSPLELSDALLCCDLFEALRTKKVKIYSDKTGTVTENFMHVRGVVFDESSLELQHIVQAFYTSFSDQKTEVEENEIKKFFEERFGFKFTCSPAGASGRFKKTISAPERDPLSFTSYKLGLFPEFGGQFTLRQEEGKPATLVFCGIPRHSHLAETDLFEKYQSYLSFQDPKQRGECLTRDWCVAETKLEPEAFRALFETLAKKDGHALSAPLLSSLVKDLKYLGTCQIDNPIKKGAKEAIRAWKSAGIDFKLITGDTKAACKLVAQKLFGVSDDQILDKSALEHRGEDFFHDMSSSCVIFTDTEESTLLLCDKLEAMGELAPYIIFAQTKDIDKQKITEDGKARGGFIVACGDGCNDLMMFDSSHLAIASSAPDGSFARGVEESCNLTDLQIKDLCKQESATVYELFDIQKGAGSLFLKHFTRLANTPSKVITALLAKPLKNIAIPRLLGYGIKEIPLQFGKLLAYDAIFLIALYHSCLKSSYTPLLVGRVSTSKLPYMTLASCVALASLQSCFCFQMYNKQITAHPILVANLILTYLGFEIFLTPGGYRDFNARNRLH